MSMTSFENEIIGWLRRAANCRKLTKNDMQEWSTDTPKLLDGEVAFHLPLLGVTAVVLQSTLDKKRTKYEKAHVAQEGEEK